MCSSAGRRHAAAGGLGCCDLCLAICSQLTKPPKSNTRLSLLCCSIFCALWDSSLLYAAPSESAWNQEVQRFQRGTQTDVASSPGSSTGSDLQFLSLLSVEEINHDGNKTFELVVPYARWLLAADTTADATTWRNALRSIVRSNKGSSGHGTDAADGLLNGSPSVGGRRGQANARLRSRRGTVTVAPKEQEKLAGEVSRTVSITGWLLKDGGSGSSRTKMTPWHQLYCAIWNDLIL